MQTRVTAGACLFLFGLSSCGLGLGFHCLVSQAAADEFLAGPDLWHPIKSGLNGALGSAQAIRAIPSLVPALRLAAYGAFLQSCRRLGCKASPCIGLRRTWTGHALDAPELRAKGRGSPARPRRGGQLPGKTAVPHVGNDQLSSESRCREPVLRRRAGEKP